MPPDNFHHRILAAPQCVYGGGEFKKVLDGLFESCRISLGQRAKVGRKADSFADLRLIGGKTIGKLIIGIQY